MQMSALATFVPASLPLSQSHLFNICFNSELKFPATIIVRSIEIGKCLFWIVQCNFMKLSQLRIGPLLSSVHTLGDIATDMSPHTYLCQLCVLLALQRRVGEA